jgi:transcriptional regulator with XRE-family HTH domain
MDDAALGASIRALRHRRGWRQADLARRAGVSASLVSLLEAGRADRLTLRAIRGVAAALDLRLAWDAGFHGSELARLRDADHARLTELLVRRLERLGWLVAAEISFNNYGERGRIDVLAYHTATRTLLVVEVKTLIVEVQAILGGLSVRQRVAPSAARSMGWRPARVVTALVVREGRTNRRRLEQHGRLFARLSLRGRAALAWLRRPVGEPGGLLILVGSSDHNRVDVRQAGRQRVRVRAADSRSRRPATSEPTGH